MKSYDVLLNGEPYLFGPASARGGIALGAALTEPGQARQVDTILIPAPTHGFGQEIAANDPKRCRQLFQWEVTGGTIVPSGSSDNAFGVASEVPAAFDSVGAVNPDRHVHMHKVASSNAIFNPTMFIAFPQSVQVWDGTTVTGVLAAPAGPGGGFGAYTSMARWRGKLIIGIEAIPAAGSFGDVSKRYGYKYAEYDFPTNVGTNMTAGGDVAVSHIATNSNFIFRIVNYGRFRPPELFIGDVASADFGSIAWVGPILVPLGGYCTNMITLGPHLLIFKRGGCVLSFDSGEVFSPVYKEGSGGDIDDDLWGASAVQYTSHVVFTTSTKVYRIDVNTLQTTDITPAKHQNLVRPDATTLLPEITRSLAPDGDELFAGAEDSLNNGRIILRGVTTRDGFNYTNMVNLTTNITSAAEKVRGVGMYKGSAGNRELIVATKNGANGSIYRQRLYEQGFLQLPVSYAGATLYESSRLTPDGAASGLTVRPLAVRLWKQLGSAIFSLKMSMDEGAYVTLGAISAIVAGPQRFEIPSSFAPLLGRLSQLKIDSSSAPGAGILNRIDFPIAIDFEYAPANKDAVTLKVFAGEQIENMGGEWIRRSPRKIVDDLLALRRTLVTLEFPDGVQWSVFVAEVASAQVLQETPELNSPSWLVTLELHRL